jgi:hypothetical protein
VAKIFSLLKSCETVFSPPVTTSNYSITHRLVTWSRPMEPFVSTWMVAYWHYKYSQLRWFIAKQ